MNDLESENSALKEQLRLANIDVFNTEAEISALREKLDRAEKALKEIEDYHCEQETTDDTNSMRYIAILARESLSAMAKEGQ